MASITPLAIDKSVTYKGDSIPTHLSMVICLIDDFTKTEPIGQIRVMIKERGVKPIKNLSGYYIFIGLAEGQYVVDILSDLYFLKETTPIDTSKIKFFDVTLEFANNGPVSGMTSTILKDVSKLQTGDTVEFHNPDGDTDKRIITVDANTKKISWAENEELNNNFNATGSTILALKNPVVSVPLKPLPSYPFPYNATLVRGLIIDSSNNPVVDATIEVENPSIETKSDIRGEFVLYFNDIKGDEEILINFKKNGKNKLFRRHLKKGVTIPFGKIEFP